MACLSTAERRSANAVAPISSDEIHWVQTIEQAVRLSRSQQRPILIHFFGDNCPPCKMLDKKAFRDTSLIQVMNSELIAVRINADAQRDIASQYKVNRWPTDVYLYPNGEEIYRNISSQDPVAYAKTIEKVSQKCRDWNLEQRSPPNPSALAMRTPSSSGSLIAKTPLPLTSQPMAELPASDSPAKPSLASRFGQWTKSLKGTKSKPTSDSAVVLDMPDPALSNPRAPALPRGSGDIAASFASRPAKVEQAARSADERTALTAPLSVGSRAPSDAKLSGARSANAAAEGGLLSMPPASTFANPAPSPVRLVSDPRPTSSAAILEDATTSLPTSVTTHSASTAATPSPAASLTSTSAQASALSDLDASTPGPSADMKVAIVKEFQDPSGATAPPSQTAPIAPVVPSDSQRIAPELALQGYCPVKLHQAAHQPASQSASTAWVPGRPEFAIRHRGRIYHCSSAEARAILLQSPDTWTPVLSGCDLVEFARSGKWVDGDCQFGFVEQRSGRIYLFASKANYDEFARNCEAYSKMVGEPSLPE